MFTSCDGGKINDDANEPCYQNCTGIVHRFITTDSVGIPGIALTVKNIYGGGTGWFGGDAGTNERIIARGVSNNDGYVFMNVSLKDHELKEGTLSVQLEESTLRRDLYFIGGSSYVLPAAIKRDTIITKEFYYPLVNYITVHLNNFEPINKYDSFRIANGLQTWEDVEATAKNSVVKLKVAPNELNTLYIARTKNGKALQPEKKEIFIPWNNDISLSFDY